MARSRDAWSIARIRRGDMRAFERLFARHQPAILSFCAHLTGSREDAEDAVQHTFLACYRRILDSDERLDLEPWLFAVARNRCLSLLRARRETAVADPGAGLPAGECLAAQVERRQELRDLVVDMARLPEPQRAALVLSQLDALSHREIGTVLDVPPQKVKALVFQARSTLASAREARDASCVDIRQELATARGASRRRRTLRRHVHQCEGCREFEVAVLRQRHELDLLLPVPATAALADALRGVLGQEGAAAGSAGAAGAGAAVAAGGGGAGLAGSLAALGAHGVAKLAVVAVAVGGGATGVLAAELPQRIERAAPWHAAVERRGEAAAPVQPGAGQHAAPARPGPAGGRDPGPGSDDRGQGGGSGRGADGTGDRGSAAGAGGIGLDGGGDESRPAADGDRPGDSGGGGDDGASGLPPGLARREELPPGLAKRGGDLPPGLAKRGGSGASPGNGNAKGNGGGQGNGNGNANGNGNGKANGNGGNQGNGQGNGNGNANGNANGNGGNQGGGNGNGGGQGNGNGNANGGGQGNGQGNGNGGGQGNGNGNGQGNGNAGAAPGNGKAKGNGGNQGG